MNLETAIGAGGTITLGDKEFRCTPLNLEDFAEAQIYLKAKTPNPMEGIAEICNSLNTEVAKTLIKEAYAASRSWGSLDTPEGRMWSASADGLAFFLFRQTRKHHPDVSLEEITNRCKELESAVVSTIMTRLAEISGLDANPTPRVKRKPPAKRRKR